MSNYVLVIVIEDTSFQMVTKPTNILSNRASRYGVQPSTPHPSGFRGPCIWPFL